MKKLSLLSILVFIYIGTYSQEIDYAKSIVKKLSSPEYKGRGYTEDGNLLSAEFISAEFKNIGIIPFNENYYQKFNISINTFPNEIFLKINGAILTPGVDYLIESSSPSIKGRYSVVKISRKEINSKEKLISVLNRVGEGFILLDNSEKSTEDNSLTKKIDEYISFLKYNPQIHCKGIIIYMKEKLNWENSTFQNVRPIIEVNKEINLNEISQIDLRIDSKFIKSYETRNIVGYIKGSSIPDSFIVIIAHYDHLGKMGEATYFPGANDNASGVAMLLSLAKCYAKNTPKYSMLFISLSAEEVGILGAKEFTDHPLIELSRIKFLVNFDLAGTGDEGIKVVNGTVYKSKFDLLKRINSENNYLPKIEIRGPACNSDHCLFYEKGVPCFYIYTLGGISAYHDIYDRYETLPFTEFVHYYELMIKFFNTI